MIPNMRVLTINSLGETEKENARVTLSAAMIKMVAAQDGVMQNRPVKIVTVYFLDSEEVSFALTEFDLLQIESVVGAYGFLEE